MLLLHYITDHSENETQKTIELIINGHHSYGASTGATATTGGAAVGVTGNAQMDVRYRPDDTPSSLLFVNRVE